MLFVFDCTLCVYCDVDTVSRLSVANTFAISRSQFTDHTEPTTLSTNHDEELNGLR